MFNEIYCKNVPSCRDFFSAIHVENSKDSVNIFTCSSSGILAFVERWVGGKFHFTTTPGAHHQLTHTLPEITAKEGVQQRIDAGIEVGHQEGQRREQSIKIWVSTIGPRPTKQQTIIQCNKRAKSRTLLVGCFITNTATSFVRDTEDCRWQRSARRWSACGPRPYVPAIDYVRRNWPESRGHVDHLILMAAAVA